jgi:hypothetical protein
MAAQRHRHPGVQIICRDRSGPYAKGGRDGRTGRPAVRRYRWHLIHNLGEAVDKTATADHASMRAAWTASGRQGGGRGSRRDPRASICSAANRGRRAERRARRVRPERSPVNRTRERYATVAQLLAEGASLGEISRQLQLDRSTVRRFARATSIDGLLVKAVNRASLLDGYTEHLTARFTAGATDAARRTRRDWVPRQRADRPPLPGSLTRQRPATTGTAKRPGTASGTEAASHYQIDHDGSGPAPPPTIRTNSLPHWPAART